MAGVLFSPGGISTRQTFPVCYVVVLPEETPEPLLGAKKQATQEPPSLMNFFSHDPDLNFAISAEKNI